MRSSWGGNVGLDNWIDAVLPFDVLVGGGKDIEGINTVARRLSYDNFIVALASVLALVFLGSLARAVLGPQIKIEDEQLIHAPFAEVWEYVTENDKRVLWETGIISILPLETGEFKPGARNLLIYSIDESTFEVEETILRFELGKLEANRSYENFDSIWKVEISELDGGRVLVSVRQTRRPKKFYLKWLAPWLQWRDAGRLARALRNLSDLVGQPS